jgi:hypothetical protein
MPIRVEVLEDGQIQIFRSWVTDQMTRWLTIRDEATAFRIVRYLLRREIRRVRQERFVPQLDRDCKRELSKLIKERANATR